MNLFFWFFGGRSRKANGRTHNVCDGSCCCRKNSKINFGSSGGELVFLQECNVLRFEEGSMSRCTEGT